MNKLNLHDENMSESQSANLEKKVLSLPGAPKDPEIITKFRILSHDLGHKKKTCTELSVCLCVSLLLLPGETTTSSLPKDVSVSKTLKTDRLCFKTCTVDSCLDQAQAAAILPLTMMMMYAAASSCHSHLLLCRSSSS